MPVPVLGAREAREDAATFLRLLEETHPDPYAGREGPRAFRAQAAALLEGIPAGGLPVEDLKRRLSRFLAPLRDGHTGFRDTPGAVQGEARLPLSFAQAADGLFLQAADLPAFRDLLGCRLVSVHGRPLASLLESMAFRGENASGDLHLLRQGLGSRRFLEPLLEGGPADELLWSFMDARGKLLERRTSWSQASRKAPALWAFRLPAPGDGPGRGKAFHGQILKEPRVGYLKIGSTLGRDAVEYASRMKIGDSAALLAGEWRRLGQSMPADPEQALGQLPSLFEVSRTLLEEMRRERVRDLVVDLRENTGGYTPTLLPVLYLLYGDEAYGHPEPGTCRTRISPLYLDKQHLDLEGLRRLWKRPGLRMGDFLVPAASRDTPEALRKAALEDLKTLGFSCAATLEALAGQPLWRPERVLVLCGPSTFSAGFHAMVHFKEHGARILGTPSRQSPNAFMDSAEFQLPRSGLRGTFSLSIQAFLPGNPSATLYPVDLPATWEVYRDHAFDPETPLRWALEILGRTKGSAR